MAKIKQQYIKSENRKWLIGYFLLHIVIFALFSNLINFSLNDSDQLISKFKSPQGLIWLAVTIFIIVLEGVFKNSAKEFLVFWKLRNRLPGHRAFSRIGPEDSRIDMERLARLFPNGVPEDEKEQNKEWFHLYRQYQNELQVFHSHKVFLLTRDFTSLTVAFIPLAILGHVIADSRPQMLIYHLLFLFFLFVVISLSARHYGERFVANVLVEATIEGI